MEHVAVWTAAFLTLGIISFLYKDNAWYKLSEAIFVGVSAGYWFVMLFWDNIYEKFWQTADFWNYDSLWADDGVHIMVWIGALLGLLMLMRLVPKVGWISRWSLAFIVGCTAGLYMINYFVTNVIKQLPPTIMPLFGTPMFSDNWTTIISSIVIAVGTFTGLVYFFFSKEHTGAFGATAKVGIWFIMVTFGASFGYTVMSRMSLLIGRIDFLLGNWLGLIK